ncbi:DUF2478 domain-containing protein [Taklimakanibacter lacteus]|uniref:DUF2478 domain-containing protein n=1 Tax=Taklimakanibacter lacteus TaxID=2268456 RepID=UPI000E66574F
MQLADRTCPITAIAYSDSVQFEVFLQEVTALMIERGMRLAGLIQHRRLKPGHLKHDILLQDLATGQLGRVSDDRGPEARGCVLNADLLLRACESAAAGLSSQTDLLVLCKFGRTEAEGGGFRGLMAKAIELSVPVLIGVPRANLAAFREFSEGLAREIELTADFWLMRAEMTGAA